MSRVAGQRPRTPDAAAAQNPPLVSGFRRSLGRRLSWYHALAIVVGIVVVVEMSARVAGVVPYVPQESELETKRALLGSVERGAVVVVGTSTADAAIDPQILRQEGVSAFNGATIGIAYQDLDRWAAIVDREADHPRLLVVLPLAMAAFDPLRSVLDPRRVGLDSTVTEWLRREERSQLARSWDHITSSVLDRSVIAGWGRRWAEGDHAAVRGKEGGEGIDLRALRRFGVRSDGMATGFQMPAGEAVDLQLDGSLGYSTSRPTKAWLEVVRQIRNAVDAEVAVAIVPSLAREAHRPEEVAGLRAAMVAAAKGTGLPVFDVSDTLAGRPAGAVWHDGGHMSAAGAAVVSKALAAQVSEFCSASPRDPWCSAAG